ncbi:hypothetical protein RQP46_000965 [Phenoliferia psychrophenolica]
MAAHHRSESEVQLASLHLSEYPSSRSGPSRRAAGAGSQISDDDLEALEPLEKSVVEVEEAQQLGEALRALSLLNRDASSSATTPDVFSPFAASPCPPDAVAPFDNYFHHSRPLYSSGRHYGRSSSATSSSAESPGGQSSPSSGSSSSGASSCGPITPEPHSPKMSTLASRRGSSKLSLDFSSLPTSPSPSAPPSKTTRGFASPAHSPLGAGNHGLLKGNFGGITVKADVVDLDGPLTPLLRTRRPNGFAF